MQGLKNIAQPIRVFKLVLNDGDATSLSRPISHNVRRVVIAAVIVIVLTAIGSTVWQMRNGIIQVLSGSQAPTSSASRLSIVVLPFANLSGDPAQEYLADVITEELTTSLARLPGSFVVARSTALTYKGKPVDLKQIGKELGGRYALEGSAQKSANRVRVNAQLIDVEIGAHLWADQIDAVRADLLQSQDQIVTRLARMLEIYMVTVDAARPLDPPSRCGGNGSHWGLHFRATVRAPAKALR